MTDSIIVRVALDAYDFLRPNEKQTAVHVQIPGVARASWLLDPEMYHGLKLSPWPDVVDAAQTCYVRGHAVTDSASAAARDAVMEWLRDDANRDEMQAAYEADRARRDPVARKLLAKVAELEAQRVALAERLRAGQQWQRGRNPELVSENFVSQSELRSIFGIPLVAPWAGGAS